MGHGAHFWPQNKKLGLSTIQPFLQLTQASFYKQIAFATHGFFMRVDGWGRHQFLAYTGHPQRQSSRLGRRILNATQSGKRFLSGLRARLPALLASNAQQSNSALVKSHCNRQTARPSRIELSLSPLVELHPHRALRFTASLRPRAGFFRQRAHQRTNTRE